MKLPKFIKENLILKITSLNAAVIFIRLGIAFFVTRYITIAFGEAGHAMIGQIRNLIPMLTSTSTLGVFNGVVKYVSELKENKQELTKLFSTVALFALVGVTLSCTLLFIKADYFALKLFSNSSLNYVIKILAVSVPFIAMHRIFNAVINGISDYKSYAKVDLIGYIFGVIFLGIGLYYKNLEWVLIAIAITPILQLVVLLVVFGKTLKLYFSTKTLKLALDYKSELLVFTLMSFVSTILINYVEIDLRTRLIDSISEKDAAYWTAVTHVSKNYMVFASGLFTLYILPKFATITTKNQFYKELFYIYKTILPIFGLGMILVYLLRGVIIDFLYPGFTNMNPLFKWQLLGDFLRIATLVLSYQFLAKKMVKSFVITELVSVSLFYILSLLFIKYYGTEGIVIAHFVRYIIYFIVVAIFVWRYFKYILPNQKNNEII